MGALNIISIICYLLGGYGIIRGEGDMFVAGVGLIVVAVILNLINWRMNKR